MLKRLDKDAAPPSNVTDLMAVIGQTTQLKFTIELINDIETLRNEWAPVFTQIFTDEDDREPLGVLEDRFLAGENFFLLRDAGGKPVGIELSQVLLEDETASPGLYRYGRAMYVPWTGVLDECRNTCVGAKMSRTVCEFMRVKYGVTHTLLDIEDPDRLHKAHYSAKDLPQAVDFARRRINFWQREGYVVVDDESRGPGEKLEYCRPASDNVRAVQSYDHMAIGFTGLVLKSTVMNAGRSLIRKNFVRECYLSMNRIQYGNLPEEMLRSKYPAIDQYLRDLDAVPRQWLPVKTGPVRPKFGNPAQVLITIIDKKAGQATPPKQVFRRSAIKKSA